MASLTKILGTPADPSAVVTELRENTHSLSYTQTTRHYTNASNLLQFLPTTCIIAIMNESNPISQPSFPLYQFINMRLNLVRQANSSTILWTFIMQSNIHYIINSTMSIHYIFSSTMSITLTTPVWSSGEMIYDKPCINLNFAKLVLIRTSVGS